MILEILVLDDSPSWRMIIQTACENEGHKVQSFEYSSDLIEKLFIDVIKDPNRYDVAFLDVGLNVDDQMNGHDVAERVLELSPNTRIFMITSEEKSDRLAGKVKYIDKYSDISQKNNWSFENL